MTLAPRDVDGPNDWGIYAHQRDANYTGPSSVLWLGNNVAFRIDAYAPAWRRWLVRALFGWTLVNDPPHPPLI
jgi:hypothetical protein